MAYNTKAIKTDLNARPIPQLYNPVTDEYEVLQGTGGAARQVLYGPDGQPISTTEGKLAVRAAELEEKLEAVRVLLNTLTGEDFATQTTLAQILGKMIAAPATEAKQDVIAGHVDSVETLLTALTGKDFATQTTLAQILAKMIASPATAAKQDSLATLVGAIEDKLDGVIDGTTPATTQLTGSLVPDKLAAAGYSGHHFNSSLTSVAANTIVPLLEVIQEAEIQNSDWWMNTDKYINLWVELRKNDGTYENCFVILNSSGSPQVMRPELFSDRHSSLFQLAVNKESDYVIALKDGVTIYAPCGFRIRAQNINTTTAFSTRGAVSYAIRK